MKLLHSITATLLLFSFFAIPAFAAKRASAKWGEELFKDPAFAGSKNEKSCFSCHENDKKMKKRLVDMPKEQMTKTINACITKALQGEPLDEDSEEMRAMRMYFNLLADDCYGK